MIERIDTLCMKVKSVEKSSDWYEELLGFSVVFKGEGYRVLRVGDGSNVPLTIEEGNITNNVDQSYPIFYSKDIQGLYAKLNAHNVRVSELNDDGVNHFFDFFDLDDNKLQVCYFKE
ncbi:VOC family protein [Guptibacillus sedimenti]|uniref:VOC family protein n=1 Tax=Guptibacillus sedimenti TaxID=3025680 RepID=UPI002361D07C|nr:VOC family protein [Pseudalkalibacillus sedimenti]